MKVDCHPRPTMESFTPEQNLLLSCLLDDVTGTEEMVKIRRDFCKITDCFRSCNRYNCNRYYTGSKAEGLDLPGSDDDYMLDINNMFDIEVSESEQSLVQSTRRNKLLIVTDNVHPAFAMLKCVTVPQNPFLLHSVVKMGNDAFLSSEKFISPFTWLDTEKQKHKIQGPSIEMWFQYDDPSQSGHDNVPSIHSKVWSTSAAEWKGRPRHYGWPSQDDKGYIEQFGCHVVPVGHPVSTRKSLEWRLSFSVAERTLVWSFNHTQLQCYAVMKLILKDVIKKKCSEKHKSVLCSYFIKTMLFWQFERTESSFWKPTNLTDCLMYLINAFRDCIRIGVLRHYFVPHFNLLEIKLTREAQSELLHIFEMVLEVGVPIFGQCDSSSRVFSKFCKVINVNQFKLRKEEIRRYQVVANDLILRNIFTGSISHEIHMLYDTISYEKMLAAIFRLTNEGHCSTALPVFTIKHLCRVIATERLFNSSNKGHKCLYYNMKMLKKNVYGTDKASSMLWLATFLLQRGDYSESLQTLNNGFISTLPYVLYNSTIIITNDNSKQLYGDRFCKWNSDVLGRAKETWLFDIHISLREHSFMPPGIQTELDYCDQEDGIWISPFTYAYYLMFLCYHELGQYENRNHALQQLVDTVDDREKCCIARHFSYNIAGHCMLMAGYVDMARTMFLKSAEFTRISPIPVIDKYNAAYAYLSCI